MSTTPLFQTIDTLNRVTERIHDCRRTLEIDVNGFMDWRWMMSVATLEDAYRAWATIRRCGQPLSSSSRWNGNWLTRLSAALQPMLRD